jgi:hypothetical protein
MGACRPSHNLGWVAQTSHRAVRSGTVFVRLLIRADRPPSDYG